MISPSLLRYYVGGVIKIYYNITWGGVFPIYYNITMGGGDPKFVLRNIWTTPYYYFSGQDQVYMN